MPKGLFRSVREGKRKADLLRLPSISLIELGKSMKNKIEPALIKSHEIIVRSWSSDISFIANSTINATQISTEIEATGPDKDIWAYVDQGTPAHTIPSLTGKTISFLSGGKYNPKTLAKPARTVSGGGTVSGGTRVIAKGRKAISHPGSEGRKFEEQIAKDILPSFRREIENTFRRISRIVSE